MLECLKLGIRPVSHHVCVCLAVMLNINCFIQLSWVFFFLYDSASPIISYSLLYSSMKNKINCNLANLHMLRISLSRHTIPALKKKTLTHAMKTIQNSGPVKQRTHSALYLSSTSLTSFKLKTQTMKYHLKTISSCSYKI